MGRVRENIEVKGRQCSALFDTGARNTYIDREVASLLVTSSTEEPIRTRLGGAVQEVRETSVLQARIEGRLIATHAFVIDEIGTDEAGKPIEVLVGAG